MLSKSLTAPILPAAPCPAAAAGRADACPEEEFRAFYDRTAPQLRAYLARCSGNSSVVADLIQESYFRLLRSGFRGQGEEHRKNYLFRIATNLLTDLFRRRRGAESTQMEARPVMAPDDRLNLRADLSAALGTLSPRDRQLLWLAYVEEASHRDIARITGLRESSIRSMIFRARARLAGRLREAGFRPAQGGKA